MLPAGELQQAGQGFAGPYRDRIHAPLTTLPLIQTFEPGVSAIPPQAHVDSSAFEVEIATHHAPRRLELQRKLEKLLHAPDRHAVSQPPGMVSVRHQGGVLDSHSVDPG